MSVIGGGGGAGGVGGGGFGPSMSLAMVGLRDGEGKRLGFRRGVDLAVGTGYRGVQVWAGDRETRLRELGRSGVRDVAAAVRRAGLVVSGVDLFVPVRDYFHGELVERAVGSLCDAAVLAGELAALAGDGPGVLCTVLPRSEDAEAGEDGGVAGEVEVAVVSAAERAGAVVADCGWPMADGRGWGDSLGVGVDPAAVILSGDGRVGRALTAASDAGRLAAARVSDLTAAGRVEVGEGKLDPVSYLGAVVTAKWMVGGDRGLVVDLRGIVDGVGAARRALAAFRVG